MTRRRLERVTGLVLVGAVLATGACAHLEYEAADDPVEEARLRLSSITGAEGDVICAAQSVERETGLQALRDNGVVQPLSANPQARWREFQARGMNLSQASTQMSQAWENGKKAQTDQYNGVPNAYLMGNYAMSQFDAAFGAASNPRPPRRPRPERSEDSWARAQYATVWTEFFSAPAGSEERDRMLDWLTSRSMANLAVLRTYHEEFSGALKNACR